MEKVERIQYQAALAVTGAWQGSNRSKLYDELGWESLSISRWCKRIHKIVSNETPPYLKDKLHLLHRPLYSQNYSNTFHEIRCKTFISMVSSLAQLPLGITFGNLKEHIRSLIRPEKKCIFGIHDSSGVRYLLQLGVGLSPLRYHKNRHNFIDTLLLNALQITFYFRVLFMIFKEQLYWLP